MISIVGLLASATASGVECQDEGGYFRFDDYGVNYAWHTPPAYSISLDLNEQLIYVEDYGESYEGCNSGDALVFQTCLKSSALSFAIPLDYDSTESWDFNGRQFEKAGAADIRLLGKVELVDRIISTYQGKKTVLLYSPEKGLRGFVIPGEHREVAQAYLSVDEAGPCGICTDI